MVLAYLLFFQKRKRLNKFNGTQKKSKSKKHQSINGSSTSESDEDKVLLKESAVTSDWILNKKGVYVDEKQRNAPITIVASQNDQKEK